MRWERFIALGREDTFLKCVSTSWVMTIVGEAEVVKKSESTNQYAFHAPKKGLITSVIVYQGRKCVEVNQVVEKGDLLITGELNEKLIDED